TLCSIDTSCPLFYLTRFFFTIARPPPRPTLFPYTTLFRSSPGSCASPTSPRCLPPHPRRSPTPPPRHLPTRADRCRPVLNPIRRSEEHTSELQSRFDLVCRLLLEKKKNNKRTQQCQRQLHS